MHELDDRAVRRYLLGLLPEAEADALEESYFGDPEVFDHIRGVEDDLIDDYVAGRLAPAAVAAFEAGYLVREPLRQRVEAARALHLAARPAPARPAAARSPRWFGPLAFAAALAVAITGAVLALRARAPRPASAPTSLAHAETAAPSATPGATPSAGPSAAPSPSPVPLAGRHILLALSPTLLRGEGGAAEARIPPRTDTLVLQLQVMPSEVLGVTRLDALVETVEGARVWSGAAERVQDRENLAAQVAVPVARLPPGDYLVTLSGGGETLHRYFFRVPRS
jgi:hypothetical protein